MAFRVSGTGPGFLIIVTFIECLPCVDHYPRSFSFISLFNHLGGSRVILILNRI